MINIDSLNHVSGKSCYIDDVPVPSNTLYGAVVYARIAHGTLKAIDYHAALQLAGVHAVLVAKHIPGENQIGGIIPDEPLLAEGEVHFYGQALGLILADSLYQAQQATALVKVSIDPLPAVTDPREAARKNMLIMPAKQLSRGCVKKALNQCATVVHGRADSGGQEHLYLEPQGAIAFPQEGQALRIVSSTQGPTAVQRGVCRVLGIARHLVEVEVGRLGGAFGGKEDQATLWAALAALGAWHSGRPVKLVLSRHDDMRMTGKRHPYSSDYRIGIDEQGLILAYSATFYQNAGASADLSPAVLARTLFHATNSYFIPHVELIGYSCRTHLPPNTAFRGFGGPQGMFVIESAIRHIAEAAGMDPTEIQRLNLINEAHSFPYGQQALGAQAARCWQQCTQTYALPKIRAKVDRYNAKHKRYKKGMAMMPICFGISFTNTPMNQAAALVHVYGDGSVGISTAAIEMGQGVSTKIVQVAATTLGILPQLIRIFPSSTRTIANTSPSAASATADLNGKACQIACTNIRERLLALAAELLKLSKTNDLRLVAGSVYCGDQPQGLTWQELVGAAYLRRISLSEHGYYATPDLYFDEKTGSGQPFAYHVYGSAVCQVTVDTLLGTYQIDAVKIVHDGGSSMNPSIDLGQIEGALAQGIGWLTVEELLFSSDGRPLTDTLSTYKIPDIYHGPKEIQVAFLENSTHPQAIFNSKAVGEPPLMYGIGVFFALRDALRAARPTSLQAFTAPLTPERVLMQLHAP